MAETPATLAKVVAEDLSLLQQGQVKPTQGDTRCIVFGHLIRLAVWSLRDGWRADRSTLDRMAKVEKWAKGFGGAEAVLKALGDTFTLSSPRQHWTLSEGGPPYKTRTDEISF